MKLAGILICVLGGALLVWGASYLAFQYFGAPGLGCVLGYVLIKAGSVIESRA